MIQDAQLEKFLFGADRISLKPVRDHLVDLHDNRCFYCEGRLKDEVAGGAGVGGGEFGAVDVGEAEAAAAGDSTNACPWSA